MATRERVIKFNCIAGNSPVGLEDKDEFWDQATLQAKLILEEAQEQYDACLERDLVEVVDGWCDVDYLQTYMAVLLQEAGVMLGCSIDTVTHNNEQKFTLSKELAYDSKADLEARGISCYVAPVEYRGDTYYVVKRESDNKVMKLLGHVDPNILATIPKETMSILNEKK